MGAFRLASLTLEGFKSFASRVELSFPGAIIAIVGPNGTGKSNIADAIAWVLGEQSARLLRSQSMADVIFTGSPKRGQRRLGAGDADAVLRRRSLGRHRRPSRDRPPRAPRRHLGLPRRRQAGAPQGRRRPPDGRRARHPLRTRSSSRGASARSCRCAPPNGASCSRRRPGSPSSAPAATRPS